MKNSIYRIVPGPTAPGSQRRDGQFGKAGFTLTKNHFIRNLKLAGRLLVWFGLLGTSLSTLAFTTNDANTLFNSYSNAFYSLSGKNAYFKNNQSGGVTTFWEQAEEIECVIDAYEWTSNATYKVMITNLLNGFVNNNGSSWTGRGYNDDNM